jgi:hypothetical protein
MGPAAVPPLLVACASTLRDRPPPGGPDPVVIAATSATPDDGNTPFEAQCNAWVCGSVAGPTEHSDCGDTGDRLMAYSSHGLTGPFTAMAHDPSLHGLRFDAQRTAEYRKTIGGDLPQQNYCCYTGCQTFTEGAQGDATIPPGMVANTTCIPRPGNVQHPASDPRCPAAVELQGKFRAFLSYGAGRCCYNTPMPAPPPFDFDEPRHHKGRPIHGDAGPLTAPVADAAACDALAEEWLTAARMEHSSVAAFAKLALDLLRFGAPADLVRRAHEAALDEIRHARASFTMASHHAGRRLEPDRFDDLAGVRLDADWLEVVRETFSDGCIGETVAALEMFEEARAARDKQLAALLTSIAEDELRHAELAWSVMAWASERDPENVARVVKEALAAATAAAPRDVSASCAGTVRAHALSEIIAPCADALVRKTMPLS